MTKQKEVRQGNKCYLANDDKLYVWDWVAQGWVECNNGGEIKLHSKQTCPHCGKEVVGVCND